MPQHEFLKLASFSTASGNEAKKNMPSDVIGKHRGKGSY